MFPEQNAQVSCSIIITTVLITVVIVPLSSPITPPSFQSLLLTSLWFHKHILHHHFNFFSFAILLEGLPTF